MRGKATILAILLGVTALWALLPAASPAAAAEPWWQLLSGSRPSNLRPAPDQTEVQELTTGKNTEVGGVLVARLELGGQTVGCVGGGEFSLVPFHFSADQLCESQLGYPAIETSTALAEALEAHGYGAGVQVSGPASLAEGTFQVSTPERWPPQLQLAPITYKPPVVTKEYVLGRASSKVISEGSGRLVVTLTNLGNAPVDAAEVPLRITDSLPEGVSAYGVQGEAGWHNPNQPLPCAVKSASLVQCTFEEGEVRPYEGIEVEVLVALAPGAGAGAAGEVSVTGGKAPPGDAAPSASLPQSVNESAAPVPFGLEYFSMRAEEEGGGEAGRAGGHPFQLTTTILADSGPQSGPSRRQTRVAQPALPRNLRFTLPAGLVANLTSVPTCDLARFLYFDRVSFANQCPDEAAVGVTSVTFIESLSFGLARLTVPVFNLPPAHGEPARLGFMVSGDPVVIDTSIDPGNAYRATAEVRNITQVVQFLGSTTSLWGDPGSPAHDASRGWRCAYTFSEALPGKCEAPAERQADIPFLRMPVACASPLGYDVALEPWNTPIGSLAIDAFSESPPLRSCSLLPFDPSLSAAPTSKLASNPSGLDLGVQMPNKGLTNPAPGAISETQFKRAEVALPTGVTINPSQAEGLATCSEAQYAAERYDSAPGEGCPEASKIGSVQISTPLLEETLNGAVYVAAPYENKTGSMIGLYLVAKIPDRGILVKQPIEVRPDPVSGQIVSIAENVPQLPFGSFPSTSAKAAAPR